MRQLILLYWGCVFLMYLSQVYYPTSMQLEGPQTGRRHFMLRKADVFMIATIMWMTCFSFLRQAITIREIILRLGKAQKACENLCKMISCLI